MSDCRGYKYLNNYKIKLVNDKLIDEGGFVEGLVILEKLQKKLAGYKSELDQQNKDLAILCENSYSASPSRHETRATKDQYIRSPTESKALCRSKSIKEHAIIRGINEEISRQFRKKSNKKVCIKQGCVKLEVCNNENCVDMLNKHDCIGNDINVNGELGSPCKSCQQCVNCFEGSSNANKTCLIGFNGISNDINNKGSYESEKVNGESVRQTGSTGVVDSIERNINKCVEKLSGSLEGENNGTTYGNVNKVISINKDIGNSLSRDIEKCDSDYIERNNGVKSNVPLIINKIPFFEQFQSQQTVGSVLDKRNSCDKENKIRKSKMDIFDEYSELDNLGAAHRVVSQSLLPWQPEPFFDEDGIMWPKPEEFSSPLMGGVDRGYVLYDDPVISRQEDFIPQEEYRLEYMNSTGALTAPGLHNDIAARKERLTLHKELQNMQQTLAKGKLENKTIEAQLKENRTKAEEARTEVMLAEFKRDSARKELETVLQHIHQKRSQLREIEEELEEEEESEEDRVRINKDEMTRLLGEREQLTEKVKTMESKIRDLESRERQRLELERQLTQSKEELFNEQKKGRETLDSLKETLNSKESKLKEIQDQRTSLYRELEQKDTRMEEMTSEKEQMRKKHDKLEARFKQMENDKNQLIKEKSQEYDELKTRMQEQMIQSRANMSKESHELRVQLQQITEQLANVQAEVNRKEEQNLQLREQLLEVQQQLSEQNEIRDGAREEQERSIAKIRQEKDQALQTIQSEADRERSHALEQLQAELFKQQEQSLAQQEQKLRQEMRELQRQVNDKEVEVCVIQDKLKQQESVLKQVGDKIRAEAQERFVNLIKEERTKWEVDKDRETRHLLTSMREEMEKTSCRLREELGEERDNSEKYMQQISHLKQEIEDTKENTRLMYRDKLAALDQAKESVAMEKERELEMLKERLEQETHKTIEKLRETISKQEDEIGQLKNEKIDQMSKDKQNQTQTEHVERSLLNEINEECRKTGHVIGKTTYNLFNSWSSPSGGLLTRNALQTALANLRASNEEMRKYVQELKYEVEAQKQALSKVERTKSEALEDQRRKMQNEKLHALESLKDRLIKEHLDEVDKLHKSLGRDKGMTKTLRDKDKELREIQQSMTQWKEQTTEKLARKFQEELHREIDKRMKENRKLQRDLERDKNTQNREIERLNRELSRVSSQLQIHSNKNRTSSPTRELSNTNKKPPLSNSTNNAYRGNTPIFDSPSQLSHTGSNQTIQRLQQQVKQLQNENLQLRRGKYGGFMSTSLTDLSNMSFSEAPVRDTPTKPNQHLEMKCTQLESRAKLAEDRAARNESLLNQKMMELSKLQNTLTQQTKELMQLERAYSQIQNKGYNNIRPSSRVSFAT